MRIYSPYSDDRGTWFKGSIHCHSTGSDGDLTAEEIADCYRTRGYDFLAITDHGTQTDTRHLTSDEFLCIPGQELSRPHMVGIGTKQTIPDRLDFAGQIAAITEAGGLAILAHPAWAGLRVEDIFSQEGMCGIEIFNYICQRLNGKGYSVNIWDELLMRDKRLWGVAVDDSHFKPPHAGVAKGWIHVRAPRLSEECILHSLEHGNFYSSEGPQIHNVRVTGNEISVECSPVRHIFCVAESHHGASAHAEEGQPPLTQARFQPTPFMKYCRIEIVDENNRRAWSNPVWIEFE